MEDPKQPYTTLASTIKNLKKGYLGSRLLGNAYLLANTADISRGMIIKLDGSLYSVIEFGENKTASSRSQGLGQIKRGR